MSADLTSEVLKSSLNQPVIVKLKGRKTLRGVLEGFDDHLNLVLKDAEFITDDGHEAVGDVVLRGDNVIFVSPP